MRNGSRVVILVAAFVATACQPKAETANEAVESLLAARVSAQARAELVLASGSPDIPATAIRIEPGPQLDAGVLTYRAWISRDHWHSYQAALVDGTLVSLGGFQTDDASVLVTRLAPASPNEPSIEILAQKLAVMLDPAGGVQYLFPSSESAEPAVRAAWEKGRPDGWPRDTVALEADKWTCIVTILSRETRSYTEHWVPTVYSFVFTANSQLQAWSRRVGDPWTSTGIALESKNEPWIHSAVRSP